MLQYVAPNGQVHPNLKPDEAMQLFRDDGYTGKIEDQPDLERDAKFLADVIESVEEPDVIEAEPQPTAIVSKPIAEAFGLTSNPVVEVVTPAAVVEEEEEFAEMRGRKFTSARDKFVTKSLEEVLSNLEDLKEKEKPDDYVRNLNGFMVTFDEGQPSGQFLFRDGMGEPIKLNRKAYRDLCHSLSGSEGERQC